MAFVVIIPARYQSSRLPGKPLLDLAGKPMLLHAVARALASGASAVHVATDDARIQALCTEAGVSVCMTDSAHASGTDRCAEVARQLGLPDDAIVVNVQGDEPLIPPAVIDQVAADLTARPEAGICTLYTPVTDITEFHDPNAVKLVTAADGRVLYFSRAPIPWPREGLNPASLALVKRHVGLYAYRVGVLQAFVSWPASPLEEHEKLEQLRAMHHGISIYAAQCCTPMPPGIDTEADLAHLRRLLQEQEL